ncbi:IS66 family transposase, partial [Agathobaculum hominis]
MSKKQNSHTNDAVRIRELERILAVKDAEIVELRQKMERLNEIIRNADRARFGQSSEKKVYVMDEDCSVQLQLFNEAETEQDAKAPEPTVEEVETQVTAHKRKKKRTIEKKFAELPVQQVVLSIAQDKLKCDRCGGQFVLIGKKVVRREMILIPQQEYIVEYVTCSYACKDCEKKTGYAHIIETTAPPPLMKHSLASPSTVADVMTKKYVDGLPLARQEKIWAREGIELSRATMANWVIKCAEDWLKPIYRRMKHHLIEESSVIHADETVVQVIKEPGKAATSESRMWVYASGDRSEKRMRIFEYQPDRSGTRAASFLKGYKKCLVTDGYAGYNKVSDVTRCGCWAHMRRKWREAMPKGATTATSQAAVGYEYCNK